jgi:hypothetical protein
VPVGIPTDWVRFHNPSPGNQGKIVLPFVANISHVLTHIKARFVNINVAGQFGANLQVLDGATIVWSFQMLVQGAGANILVIDDLDTDLNIACSVGNALTVQFDAIAPGYQQNISIVGHDV